MEDKKTSSSKLNSTKSTKGIPVPTSKIPTSGRDSGTHSRSSSVSNLTTASDIASESDTGTHGFKLEDRVFVNGSKPGYIKFIGKTEFAPGIWAGVLLDEAIGKNDGSVAGVKYFTSEPMRGIFARPQKLTRSLAAISASGDISGSMTSLKGVGVKTSTSSTNLRGPGSTMGSTTSLRGTPTTSRTPVQPKLSPGSAKPVCSKLKLGERVAVSSTTGIKMGVLRFIGETDFAKGEWAGIELDDPVGKNDGSVAGKRYFSCPMKCGLFSPIHKISRAGGTPTSRTPSVRGMALTRSTSRDSISSSVSNCSKSSRVKLGVTSLTNSQKSRPPGVGIMTTSRALEESLKEKEQHIEQLLKEYDLGRAEVAKLSSQCESIEAKYAEAQSQLEKFEEMKTELEQNSIDKRKLEDLQFQIEEESIVKSDLEMQLQHKSDIFKRLEEFLNKSCDKKLINIKEILEGKETLSEVASDEVNDLSQELKGRISELEDSISKLSQEKNDSSNELESMQLKFKQFEKETEEQCYLLNNTIQEKDEIIANLKNELNLQLEKLTKVVADNQSFAQQITLQATSEKEHTEEIIKELGEKVTSLSEELNLKSNKINELENALLEKDSKITSLEENLNLQSESVAAAQDLNQSLNESFEQKSTELMQQLSLQQSLEKEISNLKFQLESEKSAKEKKILDLVTQIEQLTGSLQEKEDELASKITEVNTLNTNLSEFVELKAKLNQAEENASLSAKETAALLEEINKLKAEKGAMKDTFDTELFVLQKENEKANNILNETKDSIAQKEKLVSQLESDLNSKIVDVNNFSSEIKLMQEKIKTVNEEKDKLLESFQTQLSLAKQELTDEMKQQKQKQLDLEKQIEQLTDSLQTKEDELIGKTTQINNLNARLNELIKKQEEMKVKLSNAEGIATLSNKETSEKVSKLQENINILKNEKEEMKKSLEAELVKEKEASSAALNEARSCISQKEDTISRLNNDLKSKEADIIKISEELIIWQEKVNALNEEKRKVEESLQLSKEGLDDELKLRQQAIGESMTKISEYEKMLESNKLELFSKESDISSLKKSLLEKEFQFDELSQMIEASKSQLDRLNDNNEKNVKLLETKEIFISDLKAEMEAKLKEREENLKAEIKNLESIVLGKEEIAKQKEEIISKLMSQNQEQQKVIEVLNCDVEKNKLLNEKSQQSTETIHKEFIDKIADLEAKYQKLLQEKEKIANDELKTRNDNKNLAQVRDTLMQEKVQQEEVVKDREAQLEALQAKVNKMQAEFTLHKQELEQKLDVTLAEKEAALELKMQLDLQHSVLEELQGELEKSENKAKKLELECETMPKLKSEKSELMSKVKEFENIVKGKSEKIVDLENENQATGELLQNNQNTLFAKEKECISLKEQIQNLAKESETVKELQSKLKSLEEENKFLKLKSELKPSPDKITEKVDKDSEKNDSEERESLISQIDFLNSIIVDMKQKNEDLQRELHMRDNVFEENELNLNEVRKIPPRLFCDICDMFDLHDTDDCPKQESFIDDGEVPHLVPQGTRQLDERPYCNNCEIFGHWTLDCKEEEEY